MSNKAITLYPSNWLYNAGVVGLLRVLESAGENISGLLSDDGTIEGNVIDGIKTTISDKIDASLPKPLNELPAWHWNYARLSFEWNYGSLRGFVTENLERAQRVTNRTQLRDQLKCKGIDYENCSVDFKDINERITDLFGKAVGRNARLTVNQAIDEIVETIDEKKDSYIYRKSIGYLFARGGFYQNFFNPGWFNDLRKFIEFFTKDKILKNSTSKLRCALCSRGDFEVEPIDATQMSLLFPVFSQFPNAYWQNNEKAVTQICSFCRFIIIHQHLALTRLSDGSEIFINAPSFKVMYHLNKFAQEAFGASSSGEAREKREILAVSVVEYATKLKTTLGVWMGMNLEIVSRKGETVEFFSLPHEVVQLLSDREIAARLSEIGEFKILNLVLKQQYSRLTELGYRLLRIALSDQRGKQDNDFIRDWLYLGRNKQKQNDLRHTAENILQLYALIEHKLQRSKAYEHTSITAA